MPRATVPFINRAAIIFDFDGTLAPDSFASLLESCGIDKDSWEQEHVEPRVEDGWDHLLAKMASLIETSQSSEKPITCQHLANIGEQVTLFNGVPDMFDTLRSRARAIIPDIEVEYYCISSGFGQIVRGTPIAKEFKEIYGCEFFCDESDRITFVKRVVTHSEKVRYIQQVAKGLSLSEKKSEPQEVYRNVPAEDWHVPLHQVIYVGDGASDQPVFHLLNGGGGIAIGVAKGDSVDDWQYYQEVNAGEHLQNLVTSDFEENSELMQSLTVGLESICKRIQLTRLGKDE